MAPSASAPAQPQGATGCLVLADGSIVWGRGFGAVGDAVGEVCFNTAMTGYQEVMTDPSYAAQIVTFTFPHIGNVGANGEDVESAVEGAVGCVVREDVTQPSNFRSIEGFTQWMARNGKIGLSGVDTRALTRRIRDSGAPAGVICHDPDGNIYTDQLVATAQGWPGLAGMDLAIEVTGESAASWIEGSWDFLDARYRAAKPRHRVVAMDFGCKHNILRCLTDAGCDVTVVPAQTTAADILKMAPDGVFLSNGPGDPAATGSYAAGEISTLIDSGMPVFGICIGHQLMALAMGANTHKMDRGHRGANHPVKDLATGRIEITSQNHGFVVDPDTVPNDLDVTHISLFDGSIEGLRHREKPAFCVQYHPESSPGPHDSRYLFDRFTALMDERKA